MKAILGQNAIGEVIKQLRINARLTQDLLAEKVGVTRAAISAIEKGKNGASDRTLKAIADALGISKEDLLLSKVDNINLHSGDARDSAEVLSPSGTTNARRIPLNQLNIRVLPYLPIGARAGLAEHYADDLHKYPWENAETLAVLDVPDTKEFAEAIIVDVNGDSMEPTLKSGSKVVVTPVQQGNWQYLNSGIYCVIYAGNFVIKRIKDNTLMENGILRLHSDNPQGGSFPVKGDDIRAIWRVRWAAYVPI